MRIQRGVLISSHERTIERTSTYVSKETTRYAKSARLVICGYRRFMSIKYTCVYMLEEYSIVSSGVLLPWGSGGVHVM